MKSQGIDEVAVIGAGTMGHGIAQLCAQAGCKVKLYARRLTSLQKAIAQIRSNLEIFAEKGIISPDDVEPILSRIHTTADIAEAARKASLAVEAVPEDKKLKKEIFKKLDLLCPEGAILASTTSGLNIFEIASDIKRQAGLIIIHFWNPPHIVPLVEMVRGPHTSDSTVDASMAMMARLGKKPVLLNRYIPGFIGVRLASAIYREAIHLLSSGVASAADIDAAVSESISFRLAIMGLLEVVDYGGLDVFSSVWDYMFKELDNSQTLPDFIKKMVEAGRLGLKTGDGFYDYSGRDRADMLRRRDNKLIDLLIQRKTRRK